VGACVNGFLSTDSTFRNGGLEVWLDQVVECLLCKHEALNSNPSPTKKKKKKRKKENGYTSFQDFYFEIICQILFFYGISYFMFSNLLVMLFITFFYFYFLAVQGFELYLLGRHSTS
jgi:hypothetical protein